MNFAFGPTQYSTDFFVSLTCAVDSARPDPLVVDVRAEDGVEDLLLLLTVVDLFAPKPVRAEHAPESGRKQFLDMV